jgi:glyoxylase-like metal-dependent hydrolase (beta-lactamase superfamily II)
MALHIQKFTFNPFQENSYVVSTSDKSAVIIDPGCLTTHEKQELSSYISKNQLEVKALLSTHCHIDHVLGNAYVLRTYPVDYYMHKLDLPVLAAAERSAQVYGIEGFEPSPQPTQFLEDKQILTFGEIELEVIFGPGHAPGHVAFYSPKDTLIISGDILFQGSFGRVDLPGGDIEILKKTIKERFFTLPDETVIYCGHGPNTTIGKEKTSNYILQF